MRPYSWVGRRIAQTAVATAAVLAFAQPSAQAKFILDFTDPSNQHGYQETAALGGDFLTQNTKIQPTGTGVIDSFLRVQQPNGNATQQQGFNTSDGKNNQAPLDDVPPVGGFTRAIQLKEIPIVQVGNQSYYEFLLDVNQQNNGPVSLNQVQIFTSAADVGNNNFSNTGAGSNKNASVSFDASVGATKVFQMSVDSWATDSTQAADKQYEAQVTSNNGSGSGDMFLYVNTTAFAGHNSPDTYVTLFSQFGQPNGTYATNAGFEEWAVLRSTSSNQVVVPAPPTALLALFGLPGFAAAAWARRRRVAVA